MDDLLGIQPHLLGKIRFHRGALHPDRAFGGGQMGQQLRGVDFRKVHPSGAAAGELGQGPILLRDASDQLAGLLHNGQISGKVSVQHIVGAQGPQQRHHFPLHKGARFPIELLPQSSPDSGGSADDHHLVGIGNGLPYCGGFVPLGDTVHRADIGALAAVDAYGLSPGLFQRVGSMYPHQIGTGLLAHPAADAFFFPAHNTGIVRLDGDADG